MLFIHNNTAQIRKRGKERGARAYHHIQLSPFCPFQLIGTLSRRHFGMQDRHTFPKAAVKAHHGLIRQHDLRDQHDRLSAAPYGICDQLDIYLCLAASGHSVY